jgi:hypothetical protein
MARRFTDALAIAKPDFRRDDRRARVLQGREARFCTRTWLEDWLAAEREIAMLSGGAIAEPAPTKKPSSRRKSGATIKKLK